MALFIHVVIGTHGGLLSKCRLMNPVVNMVTTECPTAYLVNLPVIILSTVRATIPLAGVLNKK